MDATINNFDGTQRGNEDTLSQISLGQKFDGTDDNIGIVSHVGLNNLGPVTYSFWANITDSGSGLIATAYPGSSFV